MIYKVFYQETKDRNPRRETNTDFNIEFITPLSEQHLAYEKESGAFELTEY